MVISPSLSAALGDVYLIKFRKTIFSRENDLLEHKKNHISLLMIDHQSLNSKVINTQTLMKKKIHVKKYLVRLAQTRNCSVIY